MLERELENALHANRPEPPEGFETRSDMQLARLKGRRKTSPRKQGAAFAVALATLFVLSLASALAISNGWNVRQFLFGSWNTDEMDLPVSAVKQEVELDDAYMSIDSAIYDGRSLIFDWCIKNKNKIPMYALVRRFTANGERIYTDGADSFDHSWIFCDEDSWFDGEIVAVPEGLIGAEELQIEMDIILYYPERPVYLMEKFDPWIAAEKAAEGYYVIPDRFGLAGFDREESQWVEYSGGTPWTDMGEFQTREMSFSFAVKMQPDGIRHLAGETRYKNTHCAAAYRNCDITALGIYAFLKIEPMDAYFDQPGKWTLTDEKGAPVFGMEDRHVNEMYVIYGQYNETGGVEKCCDFQWYGAMEDELPDVISLTWLPETGEPVIFPMRVR